MMCREADIARRFALNSAEWALVSTLIEWLNVCWLNWRVTHMLTLSIGFLHRYL